MHIKVNTNINIQGTLYKTGNNYDVDDSIGKELLSSKCAVECKVTAETVAIDSNGKGKKAKAISKITSKKKDDK